jgi:hypothetical protein
VSIDWSTSRRTALSAELFRTSHFGVAHRQGYFCGFEEDSSSESSISLDYSKCFHPRFGSGSQLRLRSLVPGALLADISLSPLSLRIRSVSDEAQLSLQKPICPSSSPLKTHSTAASFARFSHHPQPAKTAMAYHSDYQHHPYAGYSSPTYLEHHRSYTLILPPSYIYIVTHSFR